MRLNATTQKHGTRASLGGSWLAPKGETDEGSGAAQNVAETVGESVETLYLMSFRPEQSGAEESTTLDKEPTQEKTGNLGRFLDSLRSLGMTDR